MASRKASSAESVSPTDSGGDPSRSQWRIQLIIVGVVSLCVGGIIGRYGFPAEETPLLLRAPASLSESTALRTPANTLAASVIATVTPVPLQIYVSGAVRQPQVVQIAPGGLVKDALAAAGGPLADADLDSVNLAAPLIDHQHVIVPHRSEAASDATIRVPGAQVNINVASAAELESLPGIGQTRAADIIAYRESYGSFARPEDIQNVPGIGAGLYEEIAPFITTEP